MRYSNPGSSTIGMGSGDAGATAPTTIFASSGMNGDCAGTGPVTIFSYWKMDEASGTAVADSIHGISIGTCHAPNLSDPTA